MLRRFILSISLFAFIATSALASAAPPPVAPGGPTSVRPEPKPEQPKPVVPPKPTPPKPLPPKPTPPKPEPPKPVVPPKPEPPKPFVPPAHSSTDPRRRSEFEERILLLEFGDRREPREKRLQPLLKEMRDKGYPIQRVERNSRGGDELFRKYKIRETPHFVLLVDGREIARYRPRDEREPRLETVRDELLKLFSRGRAEVRKRPRDIRREPRKPVFGLLLRAVEPDASSTIVRGQSSESTSDARVETVASTNNEEQLRLLSDEIGRARLESALANVYVVDESVGVNREGACVVVHYNEDYQESLFIASSSLFEGVATDSSALSVSARVFNPIARTSETVAAQCVYCDPDVGLALVAARVSEPPTPVAFLPQKARLKQGEEVYEMTRAGETFVSRKHEIVAVDQRRFYRREGSSEKKETRRTPG